MSARPAKGFAVYDGRGVIVWGTLAASAIEAERRFCRWNAVEQFPDDFAGWEVRPVTIQPNDKPAKPTSRRCADTAELFEAP